MLRKVFPAYLSLIWGLCVSLYLFCSEEALQITNLTTGPHLNPTLGLLLTERAGNSGGSAPPCGRRCKRRVVLCFQSARRH